MVFVRGTDGCTSKIPSKSHLYSWVFCSYVMGGRYKEWRAGGPRIPYPMHGIIYPPFNHKTCRAAPLSRPGLFISTQKICALLCIQIATLGYNSSVPCLYTPTHTITAISTNPAAYLDRIEGG